MSEGDDPRGARRLAGVRAPGDQDPRTRLAARRRGDSGEPRRPVLACARRWCWRVASTAGLMMLMWPLLVRQSSGGQVGPPFVFLALLPVVIVVVLAELSEGGLDPRVLAVLGVLSAINAVLRGLSPGHRRRRAGLLRPDPGRARVRARLRVRAGLYVAVRVGAAHRRRRTVAAVPDAGLRLGRDGRPGCCPVASPAASEIAMLAAYGVVSAYAFGLLMNLSSWPFVLGIEVPGSSRVCRSCRATRWARTCTGSWPTR